MSSNPSVAVEIVNVSKRYQMNAGQQSLRTLAGEWLANLRHQKETREEIDFLWALKDINITTHQGEALGIIGSNGAGKTTTLKLLSRVTQPTTGKISLNGRFSSLIELGAGFHPDLSGRENVFLNGTILGLTRDQIRKRFDEIVAFSELERFIDMPVKRYSSGMYARLGFAVAAHVDPDIMLIDEVLAVGDTAFQRKCYDFISNFVTSGKTTVFVSHNLYVIEQLCNRVVWLDKGQIVMTGTPSEVLPAYLQRMDQQILKNSSKAASPDGVLTIKELTFCDKQGNPRENFETGEDVRVNIRYHADQRIDSPHFCLAILNPQGGPPLFQASMLADGNAPGSIQGEGLVTCTFKAVPLMPRAYQVWGEVWGADRVHRLVLWQRFGAFQVIGGANFQLSEVGRGGIRHLLADAPVRVPYEWKY
jgi:lipopolysaccharide transport system ATP-binding protein